MNQQRLQSYINLIQQLLACPSGEEWILLRQNEALVTPELAQVMEQVANQLANQGKLKEAKFLHNLAGQIHHLFMAQTVPRSGDEDLSQTYLELIKALLECPTGSEDELLAANQELIGPGLVHMMQQVANQLAANGDQETANYLHHWATELSRLWLEQHDFQPMVKQDLEPKYPGSPPVTTPFSPPPMQSVQAPQPFSPMPMQPLQAPQPFAAVPKASPPTSVDEDEDVWAELSGEALPTSPQPTPIPAQPPAKPMPSGPVQVSAPVPALPDLAAYEQMNRHLETIAAALTKLSETLTAPAQPPTDPLWYMEVLERAYAGNWILTSGEIQKLIGVQPACPKGSESFQRGCWVFVKTSKLGAQTGWRVKKAGEEPVAQGEEDDRL